MLNYVDDNEARVVGICEEMPTFSHSVKDENFLNFKVRVERLSENSDYLIVTAPEDEISKKGDILGKKIEIIGQFRSYNNYTNSGNKLILTLFAREIEIKDMDEQFDNEIYLNGYLCKKPIYRVTPFGREIADLLIAVNRAYNKSDYIPAIAWGRNARFVKNMDVGQKIQIIGRMQSRDYQKKISDEESITKTAYEVSINKIDVEKDLE